MATKADKFRYFMLHEVGSRYVWGASGDGNPDGPDTYDCSGLFHAAMVYAGVRLTRTTADGYYHMGVKISHPSRVGDYGILLKSNGVAHHIISYVGNNDKMVAIEVEARGAAWGVVEYTI